MGKMINVFELSAGMGGTKLIADKPNRDDSPTRRKRCVVKKSTDSAIVHVEDKQKTNEMRKSSSTKKSEVTPIKMLIAQEMSKELESKRKQTNVVARLMGLDETLPAHRSVQKGEGCFNKNGYSRVTLAGALQNSRQQEHSYVNSKSCEYCCCERNKEYRDIYEVWQQPSRANHLKDQPLQNGRFGKTQDERRMALVRQKFMEAKRLAADENLLQSKEFQDALEVLSCNRDLFLRFLEEPHSLLSKTSKGLHSIPAAPQTKQITILKPSRTEEIKSDTLMKRQHYPMTNEHGWFLEKPLRGSSVPQPTRIVVLKPSSGRRNDTEPIVMPNISSPELMDKDASYQVLGTPKIIGSQEASKYFTQHLRDNVNGHRRDVSLLSSVHSNDYVGDESSLHMSETENQGEEYESFSDLEIHSPSSRHSWGYSNRYGSPCSASSFSRVSCSSEPSVIREAKRQLSERLSLVSFNSNSQENMDVQRSSSTLAEMLANSEVKKEVKIRELTISSSRSDGGEEDIRVPSATSSTSLRKDEDNVVISSLNLSRSKSLPLSSAFDNIQLNSEGSKSLFKKADVAKDVIKSKNGRSSFKGKVSSFFFSRNKKCGRNKSTPSPVTDADNICRGGNAELVGKEKDDSSHPVHNSQPEVCPTIISEDETIKASSAVLEKEASKQGSLSFRAVLALEKLSTSEYLCDNQNNPSSSNKISENPNQPSPTSVLDAPFDNDTSDNTPGASEVSHAEHSLTPIESVIRTISWDDINLDTSTPDTSNITRNPCKANEEEGQRRLFVQNILSAAGLDYLKSSMVFARWQSVDSPLDQNLLNKFLTRKEENAKSRERRSNQRLLFDCINSALLDIGRTRYFSAYPCARACSHRQKNAPIDASICGEVWELISSWFPNQEEVESGEIYNGGLIVYRLLRREIEGNGWNESVRSEIDEISKEIGGLVLEELVSEALADFTTGCSL